MGNETFTKVKRLKWGYNPAQVDRFLAEAKDAYSNPGSAEFDEATVRNVAFDRTRRGYSPDEVDGALDRMEAAFITAKRERVVAASGEEAWLNEAYSDAKSLYPRLLRPQGERFKDADQWGYRKADVDEVIDRLAGYFDGEAELSSQDLRDCIFSQAKKAKGYDPATVDVYIDRAISVLVAVE